MNTTTVNDILAISRLRGVTRATYDRADGIYNPEPLSGEWAGESIVEILGDLIYLSDNIYKDENGISDYDDMSWYQVAEMGEITTLVCDEYIAGYDSVFDIDDSSREIRDAVIEGML